MPDNDDILPGTTRLNLRDAPDSFIGAPEETTKAIQVFQIELARDLVREMQQHAKSTKGIQLSFGKTPVSLDVHLSSFAPKTNVLTIHMLDAPLRDLFETTTLYAFEI